MPNTRVSLSRWVVSLLVSLCLACRSSGQNGGAADGGVKDEPVVPGGATRFQPQARGNFDEPWAMTFLPDGSLLVTERKGVLKLWQPDGTIRTLSGVPSVSYGGQGGLGDVILHPDFAQNSKIYLSWVEAGNAGTSGAAVSQSTLVLSENRLEDTEVIWRQVPKVGGQGHFGHRLAFDASGFLWITSGERQQFTPAQDMATNLGKVIRLKDDGSIPADNPFFSQGGVTAQIWSLGHRNPLGIAFGAEGRLWVHEMGPMGGDELNLIEKGSNYGYPLVSNGDHYDGTPIPDHDTRPDLNAPEVSWTPVISPAGFVIYSGVQFPSWRGSGFIGALSGQALVRVSFNGDAAQEAERFAMGQRIREVEQGPGGHLWVLEDGENARLLQLQPVP